VNCATHRSFWHSELSESDWSSCIPFSGNSKADVVIVGGGFTGLSTAINLMQKNAGANVLLLESDFVGYGASGRNSGYVWPNFSTYVYMMRLFGFEKTRAAYRYAAEACDYVADLVQEHGIECHYRKPGTVQAALGASFEDAMEADLALRQRLSGTVEVERLDADAISKKIGTRIASAGWFDPNVAFVQPARLALGLKQVARDLGAKIYEASPAIFFQREQRGVTITTPRGNIHADRVVIATNAYTGFLKGLPELRLNKHQHPMYVHSEITAPLPESTWSAMGWNSSAGFITHGPVNHFMHRTKDGRIHWGCDAFLDVPRRGARGLNFRVGYSNTMSQHLQQFFPGINGLEGVQQWGGPVSITADGVFHLSFLKDERVLISVGCNGNGVATAHLNGKTVAELLNGETTERTETWFVSRRPVKWPGPLAASLGLRLLSAVIRRQTNSRIKRSNIPFDHI
jgi:glycine/D-amino acid oxidase-like deaminating enzyme